MLGVTLRVDWGRDDEAGAVGGLLLTGAAPLFLPPVVYLLAAADEDIF
jgi:hypothetical protein